jgi:hypothetical protein
MLPTLRASLAYTLALAVLVFVFAFFTLDFDQALSVVIGILLAGILVPILVDVKGATLSSSVNTKEFSGDSATLYVGNLPYRANEEAVKELFESCGTVKNVRLMKDRQTGRRRGFGFVEVAAKDASKMISKLNDFEFQERTLKVREAKERQEEDNAE